MFHVELAPLRGPDFIMGKNKNANFSKSPHGPIFKFFVVICEVILQKKAPILAPVNFFSVFTLISHCAMTRCSEFQIESGTGSGYS